uniref:Ig-like domain-containing protein n=1 Tax=Oryzias latipes TaxID=8090 RepID=A0A3P9LDN3_ORYLA
MSLTAALRGFVVVLCWFAGIHSQTWRVEYASKHICAFEGSTVEISCTYTYPLWENNMKTVVQRAFWFTKLKNKKPLDLREDPYYAGRVTYHFSEQSCSLRISGLRLNDSAEYKFRFETNQPGGSSTDSPGVFLTATDLQVLSQTIEECWFSQCAWFDILCKSSCVLPHSSYVWYKNGEIITDGSEQKYSAYIYAGDSVSCAVRGHESFHSPVVCVYGSSCNKVSYNERSICAFRGSTVTISCSFQSESSDSLESWFSVRGQQRYYQNTGGHDSSEIRFQVKMYRDQSSLTISDLTDSDADEYRCKTTWWDRDFPGTTLTVVDPRMQVIRSGQELVCHSSCFPLHHLSFVWFMNGQEVQGETSDYYRKPVSPEASYSCSYQGHRLPEVYAPKSVSVAMSLTEIMEGSSVTLTCSCDANPPAKFRWYKNNQTLLLEDPSLILRSVQRSDSRKFHCVAENKLGEAASDYVFINVECESNKGTRINLQIFVMFDLH